MPKNTMFSFISIPRNTKELCAMPEYHMKNPFARAALTVLVLCQYSFSLDDTVEMLNLLSGPSTLSSADISLLQKSLDGREYIPYSFLQMLRPKTAMNRLFHSLFPLGIPHFRTRCRDMSPYMSNPRERKRLV